MKDVIISMINSKLIDGIWYIVPDELSKEIYVVLKNKFPLESVDLTKPHIWFTDYHKLSFTIQSLNIYWTIYLQVNNLNTLITTKSIWEQ